MPPVSTVEAHSESQEARLKPPAGFFRSLMIDALQHQAFRG